LYSVIVSATVADPHYGSGMVNPTRAWLAEGDIPFFVPVVQLGGMMTGIRLKNPNQHHYSGRDSGGISSITGVNLTYSLFKNAYMSVYPRYGKCDTCLFSNGIADFIIYCPDFNSKGSI
jgi:hypothetical protein